jgi:hypothetical protein
MFFAANAIERERKEKSKLEQWRLPDNCQSQLQTNFAGVCKLNFSGKICRLFKQQAKQLIPDMVSAVFAIERL